MRRLPSLIALVVAAATLSPPAVALASPKSAPAAAPPQANPPANTKAPPGAPPTAEEGQLAFERGVKAYQEQRYADAKVDFALAYRATPTRQILFAWAQAERLSGDCARATALYQQLRAMEMPDADRRAVLDGLDRCGALTTAGDQDKTPPPPPKVIVVSRAAPSAPSPWYKDPIGDALLAGGVVAVGTGAFLWVKSKDYLADANAADTYDDYITFEDRARSRRTAAIVSLSIGGALAAGAVVRYVTRDPGGGPEGASAPAGASSSQPAVSTLSGWFSGEAGGLMITGGF